MEQKLDELLTQLHKHLFADAEQMITELRHYILDASLTDAQLAYTSSKIFNSDESLINFLRNNSQNNERILATAKKRIYELIIEYTKMQKKEVASYLPELLKCCKKSFVSDSNSLVKEVSLQVLIKLIDSFTQIEHIIEPGKLMKMLTDEAKLRHPSATVEGAIWQLVGLLHQKFPSICNKYLKETQEITLTILDNQMHSKKPDIKTIIGIMKGLTHSLHVGNKLDSCEQDEEPLMQQPMFLMDKLFTALKTAIIPIEQVNNRGVMKAGMKLLSTHAKLFKKQIMEQPTDMIQEALQLCIMENLEIRDAANDLLGSIIEQISESIQSDSDEHRLIFTRIMTQFDDILDSNDYHNMQLLSAIRAVGIFSRAIRTIHGEQKLWSYLERLIQLSEQKLIKEFNDQQKPESDLQNFKQILKKQKQLIAYIESYSFIIKNLKGGFEGGEANEGTFVISEKFLFHFLRIGKIGVNNHRKLYNKYRFRFYETLASLTMSLSGFSENFKKWTTKFVREALTETLKIPDSVIYAGENPSESLQDAVIFWSEYLQKDQVWDNLMCQVVYDELISICISDIENLDLAYRVVKNYYDNNSSSQTAQTTGISNTLNEQNYDSLTNNDKQTQRQATQIEYVANNTNDQQYLARLVNFLEIFLPKCHSQWQVKWIPKICQVLVKKATETPRVSKLYALLKTIMLIAKKFNYFEKVSAYNYDQHIKQEEGPDHEMIDVNEQKATEEDEQIQEKRNTYNLMLKFFKDLVGKSETFQDELLDTVMHLLLNVPIEIIYSPPLNQNGSNPNALVQQAESLDNLQLWKGILLKALDFSLLNNSLAMTSIQMLEGFFDSLPVAQVAELYAEVLPLLSNFLQIDPINSAGNAWSGKGERGGVNGQGQQSPQKENYFFMDLLKEKKEAPITRVEIANKVLDLLGKIGGYAHLIVPNDLTNSQDDFIKWDNEKRLKIEIPFDSDQKGVEIYLDSCLPRIIDLAQNAPDKQIRIAACELLHGLILYMIGRSANPQTKIKKESPQKKTPTKIKRAQDNYTQSQDDIRSMAAFAKLYSRLFPVIIKLASDTEQIARQLFEPLVFQIVRWFSSSQIYGHPEVESLLDALIQGAQSRNNTTQREMCANAVAVFASWNLKEMSRVRVKDESGLDERVPANIQSLIRRVESNSNHPDLFRRFSSVLCFSRIFIVIQDNEALIDKFCLSIASSVLCCLKLCQSSAEMSQEVIEQCQELLTVIQKVILAQSKLLLKENEQRQIGGGITGQMNLMSFVEMLFQRFTMPEKFQRDQAMKMWTEIVGHLNSQKIEQSSSSFKKFILKKYAPQHGQQSQHWQLPEISFEDQEQNMIINQSRKVRLQSRQMQFEQLSTQLEFINWLLKTAKFTYSELTTKLHIDVQIIKDNLKRFFIKHVHEPYQESVLNQQVMMTQQEDKEQVTISKIELFKSVYQLCATLSDQEIENLFSATISQQAMFESKKRDSAKNYLSKLAVQIMLVPAAHHLSLLLRNIELEKELRELCFVYLSRIFKQQQANQNSEQKLIQILENLKIEQPFVDLQRLNEIKNVSILQNVLLGYLKLGQISGELQNSLIAQVEQTQTEMITEVTADKMEIQREQTYNVFGRFIQDWVQSETPLQIEQARRTIQFMASIKLPKELLYHWLIRKPEIYQKSADFLLKYITEQWNQGACIGDYLIKKACLDYSILGVMIPIIEYVSEHQPGFQSILISQIPQNWCQISFKEEYSENQAKIYSLIVQKCEWTLVEQQTQETKAFLGFLIGQSNLLLLNQNFTYHLKKQVLVLLGLLYKIYSQTQNPQKAVQKLHNDLKRTLENLLEIQNPKSTDQQQDERKYKFQLQNYEKIVEGYLDLLDLSKSYHILSLLFRIIKEHKPTILEQRIKASLHNYVINVVNKSETDDLLFENLEPLIQVFYWKSDAQVFKGANYLDIEDNLRWAIAKKLLNRVFETCSLDQLYKITKKYFSQFRETLETKFMNEEKSNKTLDLLDQYLLIREKTHVLIFLEIVVRRLKVEQLTQPMSEFQLNYTYDQIDTNMNSETQQQFVDYLIEISLKSKQADVPNRQAIISQIDEQVKQPEYNSCEQIFRRYTCSAYNLLSSCIVKTKKDAQSYQSLFQDWSSLIDKTPYDFKIETNFNSINLKEIEAKNFKKIDIAAIKSVNMLQEYLTTSFMNTCQKFDTAMVFQTQFDQSSDNEQDQEHAQKSKTDNDNNLTQEKKYVDKQQLELDSVNQHDCMKNIKRSLDQIQLLFGKDMGNSQASELPQFMTSLLQMVKDPSTHQNLKILILKLLVNSPNLFKPFAQYWLVPICQYICTKNNGGKGFHYYTRDLTTLLIMCNDSILNKKCLIENQELCSKTIMTLIKLSPDNQNTIFQTNVKIVSCLMQQWRDILVIDKKVICQMLKSHDIPSGHLWMMTGITVVALACTYNIPIRDGDNPWVGAHEFSLVNDQNGQVAQNRPLQNDQLFMLLLKMQELKKKQLIYASSEAIGNILARQPQLAGITTETLMLNKHNNRHDILVNSIERITRDYPDLLQYRRILLKLTHFVDILTGSMRGLTITCLTRYYISVGKLEQNAALRAREEIVNSILQSTKKILDDISDNTQQSYLELIMQVIKTDQQQGFQLLDQVVDRQNQTQVIDRFKDLYSESKSKQTRVKFYSLMEYIHLNHHERYSEYSKSCLIRGLTDSNEEIATNLLQFWSEKCKFSTQDPKKRLQQLFSQFYDIQEEQQWLNNSCHLFLLMTKLSEKFEQKMCSQPLQNCNFDPMHIDRFMQYKTSGQPFTPGYQEKALINASQKVAEKHKRKQLYKQSQEIQQRANDLSQQQQVDIEMTEELSQNSSGQKVSQDSQRDRNNSPEKQLSHKNNQKQSSSATKDQSMTQGTPVSMKQEQTPSKVLPPPLMNNSSSYLEQNEIFEGRNSSNFSSIPEPVSASNPLNSSEFRKANLNRLQILQISNKNRNPDDPQPTIPEFLIPTYPTRQAQANGQTLGTRGDLSRFFRASELDYMPVIESFDGKMIRYIKDGTTPAMLARSEQLKLMRQRELEQRINQLETNSISLLREYRVGDLPDIQISFKDIMLPLQVLARLDNTIATEILVEVFLQIYQNEKNEEQRRELGNCVSNILQQSELYEYSVVNCMHRIAIELLKIDGFTLSAQVIEKTGRNSMNYQTALNLLEETILHGKNIMESPKPQNPNKPKAVTLVNRASITVNNKYYWLNLISLYEQVGNEDALKGLWSILGTNGQALFKVDPSRNLLKVWQEGAKNSIKRSQTLKQQGLINEGLKVLEDTLNSEAINQEFEDMVRVELTNKKYEAYAELQQWEKISTLGQKQWLRGEASQGVRMLSEIPQLQADQIVRSQLRQECQLSNLTEQMQTWMYDPTSRSLIEKHFNFHFAFLYITQLDFDRAYSHISKEAQQLLSQWKDLTKLSHVAKHQLVQKVQKIYEMREFLNTVKQRSCVEQNQLEETSKKQMQNWIQRSPSSSFDKVHVWDDILESRLLFLNIYKNVFKNANDSVEPNGFELAVNNTSAILYAQTAKGAYKMGLLDTSRNYLDKCLQQRQQKKIQGDLLLNLPLIKLKAEYTKQATSNLNETLMYQLNEYKKIIHVLDSKLNQEGVDSDIGSKIKAVSLKQSLHSTLINLMTNNIEQKTDQLAKVINNQRHVINNLNRQRLDSASIIKEQITQYFNQKDEIVNQLIEFNNGGHSNVDSQMIDKSLAIINYKFAQVCDRILKKVLIPHEDNKELMDKIRFKKLESKEALVIFEIESTFKSINSGTYPRARQMIPRLLELLTMMRSNKIDSSFQLSCKDTPAWIFLCWINQLTAYINRPEQALVITDKLTEIQKLYPQALYYPFKVIESNTLMSPIVQQANQTQLFKKTQQFYDNKFGNLQSWTTALQGLVHPQQRLVGWIDLIIALQKATDLNNPNQEQPWMQKTQILIQMMMTDCCATEQPYIAKKIGLTNLRFARKWSNEFKNIGFENMQIYDQLQELIKVRRIVKYEQLSEGQENLGQYSSYLSKLDNNDFHNASVFIELPGQYDNLNQEPLPDKHVKIASIRQSILTLSSNRRPKRITIHGSNEKDYHLLVKGGEDLRLDQRIQSAFHIMNYCLRSDPRCHQRSLSIQNFSVVPVTNTLGVLEWVDSTMPMKELITQEFMSFNNNTRTLEQGSAFQNSLKWLRNLPGNERNKDCVVSQHITLMGIERQTVVDAFTKHQGLLNWSLLRTGLQNLCLTSSAFLTIKSQFVKSMAVLSVASYLLGIADRHLENFLVNTKDGQVVGIDFGLALGAGVQQDIPELMPFRLTQQIEGVIAPHPIDGEFKQAMICALGAFRKEKQLILDICEIFVQEPLLDWIKRAQTRLYEIKQCNDGSNQLVYAHDYQDQIQSLSFYPKGKIETLTEKLQGGHPVQILMKEIDESQHKDKHYYGMLKKAAQGGPHEGVESIRYSLLPEEEKVQRPVGNARIFEQRSAFDDQDDANGEQMTIATPIKYLQVEEQVDCLIEMARDPNILGRSYLGWGAYI